MHTHITNGAKLMVVFIYNNYEKIRLTIMHPESLIVNTTHGTNQEKKEIFTVEGGNGNNLAFNAYRVFIPN